MVDLRPTDSIKSLPFSLVASALVLLGGIQHAHAHISVDDGGTHKSRYSDAGLKDSPCGMTGGKRGTNVYTYKPGATINVSIVETISHPGYFRIAFDSDGDDGFVIPSGTSGEMGSCSGDAKCGAGKEDYCNSDTVLLDKLDQHAAALGSQKKYTWSVKLPDIECANCTLQIIQVMNDLNFHPQAYPADDIYYQCIDIVLSKSAPDVPTTSPVTNNGMVCNASANAGSGAAGGASGMSGSAAAAGASGAPTAGAAPTGMQAGASAGGAGGATAMRPPTSAGAPSPAGAPATGGAGTSAAGTAAPVSTAGTGTMMSANVAAGAAAPAKPAERKEGGCSVSSQRGASDAATLVFAIGMAMLAVQRGGRRRTPRRKS